MIQQIQNKLLKIIDKNEFLVHNTPLKVDQMFTLESLCNHLNNLKDAFHSVFHVHCKILCLYIVMILQFLNFLHCRIFWNNKY